MRPFFSGANLGTDLVEPACSISLPYYVLQNRHFIKLIELIRRVICWANDIFSLEKELEHGDTHNLVCVISKQYHTSIPKAMIKAAEMHDNEIRLYLKLKGDLPSFGEKTDEAIQNYLFAQEIMVKGFIDWSTIDSTRYMATS